MIARIAPCLTLALAACTVGPDYEPPAQDLPASFGAAGDAAPAAEREPDLTEWWTTFGVAALDEAVAEALDHNRDLRAATARLAEARALRATSAAALGPQLGLQTDIARIRASENTNLGQIQRGVGAPLTQNSYALGVDASWELDLFGGRRRAVEAADARLEASEQQWFAVRLAVAAEVARVFLEREGTDRQLALAARQVELQQESLRLIASKVRGGLARPVDEDLARAQLEGTRAALPALEAARSAQQHRLGVLLGRIPSAAPPAVGTSRLPRAIPLGVPAQLVRRRPDVRAAERQLHAATADVGVAVAELYPRFFALGSGGLATATGGNWLESASRTWLLGAGVRWRIFESGRIEAGIRARDAAREAAWASFEQSVLAALEDVESAATAFAREREALEIRASARDAAQRAATRARSLYEGGLADVLTVLSADRLATDAEQALVEAETRARTIAVRLYQALGGGWTGGEAAAPPAAAPAGR